ncbi:MAG: hypothetical protein ACT4PI_02050 [Actinomycetota bacterium]
MSDDLVVLAGELLAACPESEHRVMLAVLERAAADQYRRWADEVGEEHRAGILECAAREEQVADVLMSGAADATATAEALGERFPDLGDRYAALLEGRSLVEQFAIQAAGERAGGALLRSYELPDAADLEDANADFLDRISQELPS